MYLLFSIYIYLNILLDYYYKIYSVYLYLIFYQSEVEKHVYSFILVVIIENIKN